MKKLITIATLALASVTAQAEKATFTANCNLQYTFAGQTRVMAKEIKFGEGQAESQFLGAIESSALSLGYRDGAAAAPFDMIQLTIQQGFVKRTISAPILADSAIVMFEEKTMAGSAYSVFCQVAKTE